VSRSKRVSARSSDNKRRRLKDHERLVSPKTLEPSRCQFGVARRMLDRLVTQIALDRAGIVALIGQLIAAGVTQHVRCFPLGWHMTDCCVSRVFLATS